VDEGRSHVIDIDIRAFFDNIDHDILMRMVAKKVRDKRVLKLLGKYLCAGVLENGKVKRGAKGAPQGGPLSPLLGNIYLDALDSELESRGVAFCRYTDDVTIYARSARSAERTFFKIKRTSPSVPGTDPNSGGSVGGFDSSLRFGSSPVVTISETEVSLVQTIAELSVTSPILTPFAICGPSAIAVEVNARLSTRAAARTRDFETINFGSLEQRGVQAEVFRARPLISAILHPK